MIWSGSPRRTINALTDLPRIFEKYALAMTPVTADLIRRAGSDPTILALLPQDAGWDVPHRLTAAVGWLVDVGRAEDYRIAPDPWAAFRATVLEHADWVRDFVRERPVQTNEVQRCFVLLPIFLTIARATGLPLDLLELGASAGLNLLWDRYRYRYAAGRWGPAGVRLELSGEERGAVPGDLLEQAVTVRRRRGIDLRPLDVRSDDDVRTLRVFAAPARHARLLHAVEIARENPPKLIAGDYLEVLPELLADRETDALTVVFQTLSAIYLTLEHRARLWEIVESAGRAAPLAYVWTPTPEEHGQRRSDYPVELAMWPTGDRRFIARMENHGEWLDWLG
jgi:hypothetical protein